ncbi:hypothetical protein AOQ84DRAFT_279185, partial [Glonium stellatum]
MLVHSFRRQLLLLSFLAFIFFVTFFKEWPYVNNLNYDQLSFGPTPSPSPETTPEHAPAPVFHAPSSPNTIDVPEKAPSPTGMRPETLLYSAKPAASTSEAPEPTNTLEYMASMLKWNRPGKDNKHWPPYEDYRNTDYDPNRWEEFKMDHRIYDNGVEQLNETAKSLLLPYLPYPKYNSPEWREKWKGKYVACKGARGVPLTDSKEDQIMAYRGLPNDFPEPLVSRPDAVGLDSDVCFDRYSRYGPYGFNDAIGKPQVDWKNVKWGELQNQCLAQNKARYRPDARRPTNMRPGAELREEPMDTSVHTESRRAKADKPTPSYHSRTAVLIRAYEGYTYEENDILAIRAMITELSLFSGGEYQVFLLVQIKSKTADIFASPKNYDEALRRYVPSELRDIAILWHESIFQAWYPAVTDWQVYWHQFMCVQWFSQTHPEFDFVWNWETDARYTGNHYHFLTQLAAFAASQPRKLLWERNSRFYLPAAHGTNYSAFAADTNARVLAAHAAGHIPNDPVWGPRPYASASPPQRPLGPTPPHPQTHDNFSWGVDEPADLLTLLPLFDPRQTHWSYKDKIWNYVAGVRPTFTPESPTDRLFAHPGFARLHRRVFVNTVVRLSRSLLRAMHVENRAGRAMVAEMWPGSVALQHGLKAVYAPHPVWADRVWAPRYADAVFNAA